MPVPTLGPAPSAAPIPNILDKYVSQSCVLYIARHQHQLRQIKKGDMRRTHSRVDGTADHIIIVSRSTPICPSCDIVGAKCRSTTSLSAIGTPYLPNSISIPCMSNTPPLAQNGAGAEIVTRLKSTLWRTCVARYRCGGIGAEKPYVASIAFLILGGEGRPDTDSGEVLGPKDATAGPDAGDD
jgi:hypothetical protein